MIFKSTPPGFDNDQWWQVLRALAHGISLPPSYYGATGAIPHLITINKEITKLRPEME